MVRRWLFSYLAASLVPMMLAILFCIFCTRKVLSSAKESSSLILKSLSWEFDEKLDAVNALGQGILLDDRFLPYARGMDEPTSLEYYQASTIIRNLVPSASISCAMVFSPKLGRYISQESWGNFTDFFLRDEFDLDMERSEIQSLLSRQESELRILGANTTDPDGKIVRRMLFIKPLNYSRGGKLHDWYLGCVVSFGEIFAPVFGEERDLLLCEDEKVLCSFSGKQPSHFSEILNGKELVESLQSTLSPYTYCLVTKKGVVFQQMAGYLLMVACLLLATGAIGAFILCFRLKRDWDSFEAAIKASGTEIDLDVKVANEYFPFVSSMKGLSARAEDLSNILKAQAETLKQHTLTELMEHGEPVSLATLKECGISFIGNHFLVMLFVLGDTVLKKEFPSALQKELGEKGVLLFPAQSSHGSLFILNSKKPLGEELFRQVEKLSERFSCQYGASSFPVVGFEKLGEAYLEAINVLEYEKGQGVHEFLNYGDVRGMTSQVSFSYTTENELELTRLIGEGASMECVSLIERIFEENQKGGASPKCLRYLLFSIASTAYRSASKLDARYTDALPELTLNPIIQGDNLEKSKKEVEDLVQRLCLAISKVNSQYADASSKSYAIYQRAIEFVHAHYQEQSLNVSLLADSLGVSIVYLSRTFKKFHAMNISDYITRYRLFLSKKLLSEGMKVADVASMCGFGSLRTYLRVFKQVEDVTPGQWRSGRAQREKE